MRYILDTNIISYLDDDTNISYYRILNKMSSLKAYDELCISILSLLEYQISISKTSWELKIKLEKRKSFFLENFKLLWLEIWIENIFVNLLDSYMKLTWISEGSIKKHYFDLLIASIAIQNNAILISNDKIFENVKQIIPDFLYENWAI